MKTTPKRILALLLALGLLLSLCACGQKEQTVPDEPKMSTDKVDLLTKADKKTPERQPEEAISQSDMSDRVSRDEATETQPVQYGFSQEAETSLGWLRDRIDVTGVMFGAAYLGYVGGLFDEGFEAGFPAWLWETNEAMLLKYLLSRKSTRSISSAARDICTASCRLMRTRRLRSTVCSGMHRHSKKK